MPFSASRFRRRKKEVIFIEGYHIDHAVDATPGFDRADETYHVYGSVTPETDVVHNYGTLTIGLLDKYVNNALLDLVTLNDPDAVGPRQYQIKDLVDVIVFANVKNKENTAYIKSWLLEAWTPGLPLPSGDPNAKAAFTVTGNGALPREFEAVWINTKKVASGASPTLGATPVEVPGEANVFAVAIQAMDETGDFAKESVTPSSAMMDGTGAITWAAIEAAVTTLSAVTDVLVHYLQSGSGVYPNVLPDKLRA